MDDVLSPQHVSAGYDRKFSLEWGSPYTEPSTGVHSWIQSVFNELVGRVIGSKSVTPYFYADDSQLYVHYNPNNPNAVQNAVLKIDQCCKEVKTWMTSNCLKLNDNKTEAIIVGTKAQLRKSKINTIEVCRGVKNIGAYIDSELTIEASCQSHFISGLVSSQKSFQNF